MEDKKLVLSDEEVRKLLIETFAQTVEYGAMCEDCCSNLGDQSGKAGCEMSEQPLEPDDYCPQQILAIDYVLPKILALTAAHYEGRIKELEARIKQLENMPM